MKLVCPVCQSEFLLAAALNDLAARNAVVLAFRMTEIGDVMINYVQLFKPAKRALSLTKLEKMLTELVPIVTAGKVTVQGTEYPAPQAYFRQAMETMLATRESLTLPLNSHRYLFKIIAGYANKESGKQERQKEQGRHYGDFHTADKAPVSAAPVVAPEKPALKPRSQAPEGWRKQIKKGNSNESNP